MINYDEPDDKAAVDPKQQKILADIRNFINFLLRNVAVVTFKFNIFFKTRLVEFSNTMIAAEEWYQEELAKKRAKAAAKIRKKKKEPEPSLAAAAAAAAANAAAEAGVQSSPSLIPTISAVDQLDALDLSTTIPDFKTMNEINERYLATSHRAISDLLDLFGRMKGLLVVAGNLMTLLNKRFDKTSEKCEDVRYYFKHWNGFCARTFNCHMHKYPSNQLPPNLTPPEVKYIVWPLAVRTAIYCASQFIKDTTELVGIDTEHYSVMQFEKFMTAEELLTMKNILEFFQNKFTNMFNLLGKAKTAMKEEQFEQLPSIDPSLETYTEPITMDTILLNFPHDVPADVPTKAKGKKSIKSVKRDKTGTVHFMLRRLHTTLFININEEKSILELKHMISKIIKVALDKFKLYREDMIQLDKGLGEMKKKLKAVGFGAESTKPFEPAVLYLCYFSGYNRYGRAQYEKVEVEPYSEPGQLRFISTASRNNPPSPQ